jgi:hypothetical protein
MNTERLKNYSAYENEIIEFSQLKACLEFLFSKDSSCYLSNNLKSKIYSYYKI